jgi:hypothetical protein
MVGRFELTSRLQTGLTPLPLASTWDIKDLLTVEVLEIAVTATGTMVGVGMTDVMTGIAMIEIVTETVTATTTVETGTPGATGEALLAVLARQTTVVAGGAIHAVLPEEAVPQGLVTTITVTRSAIASAGKLALSQLLSPCIALLVAERLRYKLAEASFSDFK